MTITAGHRRYNSNAQKIHCFSVWPWSRRVTAHFSYPLKLGAVGWKVKQFYRQENYSAFKLPKNKKHIKLNKMK